MPCPWCLTPPSQCVINSYESPRSLPPSDRILIGNFTFRSRGQNKFTDTESAAIHLINSIWAYLFRLVICDREGRPGHGWMKSEEPLLMMIHLRPCDHTQRKDILINLHLDDWTLPRCFSCLATLPPSSPVSSGSASLNYCSVIMPSIYHCDAAFR